MKFIIRSQDHSTATITAFCSLRQSYWLHGRYAEHQREPLAGVSQVRPLPCRFVGLDNRPLPLQWLYATRVETQGSVVAVSWELGYYVAAMAGLEPKGVLFIGVAPSAREAEMQQIAIQRSERFARAARGPVRVSSLPPVERESDWVMSGGRIVHKSQAGEGGEV